MDLRPLLRPRHLALTLAVGLLVGAGIATATVGAGTDVPGGLGAAFHVPGPRVGDRGVYAIWQPGYDGLGPDSGEDPAWTYRFEWLPDETGWDANGQQTWFNVLRSETTYPHVTLTEDGNVVDRSSDGSQSYNETLRLRSGTNEVVLRGGDSSRSDTYPYGFTQLGSSRYDATSSVTRFGGTAWSDLCVRSSLQGRDIPLDPAPFSADCLWANGGLSGEPVDLHARAVGGTAGQRDLLIIGERNERGLNLELPSVAGRVWLREGLPVPVRMETVDGAGDVISVAILRGFEPGTQPVRGREPLLASLPPLQLAPRQPWGADETGIDHPFPASAAWAAARDDPDVPHLRDLLANHPDAYVAQSQYAVYDSDGRHVEAWQFTVTDGTALLGLDVRHVVTAPLVAVGGIGLANPSPNAPPADEVIVEVQDDPYSLVPLAPSEAPTELPTLASVKAWWETYAGPDAALGFNTWSLVLQKDAEGGGVQQPHYSAGHVDYTRVHDVPDSIAPVLTFYAPSTSTWTVRHLQLTPDFSAVAAYIVSDQVSRTTELDVPLADAVPAPPGTPIGDAAPSTETAVEAKGLFELTPLERTAIGLGALGAALAVWLSPLAKNGLMGLFSRIRGDDLLDHPARRLVRDLVESTPGIHHQELVRRVGKGKGGTEHHVRKLVDAGLVVARASAGYTCYFVPGAATRANVAAAPVLKSDVAQGVLRLRREQPRISAADIARHLDVRPATVSYHLARLKAAGLLTPDGMGPGPLAPPLPDDPAAAAA